MSFMSCFRKSVFSSKRPISSLSVPAIKLDQIRMFSNEKPVYNPIIIFSRTSAFPTSAHKIHTTICFHLLWFYTHYKQYPPLMVQKHGTKSWHIWGVLASMSVNICDFWGSGCGTRFVQSSETCSADPSSPLWVNVPCLGSQRPWEPTIYTANTTGHRSWAYRIHTELHWGQLDLLSHFLCTLISGWWN